MDVIYIQIITKMTSYFSLQQYLFSWRSILL